jgi:amidohydrolase
MSVDDLKAAVGAEIDRRGDGAIRIARHILEHPETGFREQKTSKTVEESFRNLGVPYQAGIAITGLKAILDSGTPGPTVAVIGELDSLMVEGHPHSDPATSAAHACGHHCQIGAMLGAAMGLQAKGVLQNLAGRVAFIAVPAEEYLEIEYRDELRRRGGVEFLGGKAEFVRLGAFDDVDMAMMIHTVSDPVGSKFDLGGTTNGMVAKHIRFGGTAAHAGAEPHAGTNALNAAMIALSAIHAQRETYRDEDTVRVHPIITKGGVAVSSVPADVRMETFVRGKTTEAFLAASQKVDRALRAGAMAVGGSVTITTLPGYLPIQVSPEMQGLFSANAASMVGEEHITTVGHRGFSTDMGDLSHFMPILHANVVASTGKLHGDDYLVQDYDLAVATSAKAMAMTVVDLLADGARRASEIKRDYPATMTKDGYLSLMRGMLKEETFTE